MSTFGVDPASIDIDPIISAAVWMVPLHSELPGGSGTCADGAERPAAFSASFTWPGVRPK